MKIFALTFLADQLKSRLLNYDVEQLESKLNF